MEIPQLVSEIAVLDQVIEVSRSEAWPHIEATVQDRLDGYATSLISARPDTMSAERAADLRGGIRELRWLLELPSDAVKERKRLQEELEAAREDE